MPMAQARFNSALEQALAMAPGTTYLGGRWSSWLLPALFLAPWYRRTTTCGDRPRACSCSASRRRSTGPDSSAPRTGPLELDSVPSLLNLFRRCSNPEVRGQQFSPGLPSHPPPYLPAPPHEWVDYSLLGRLHWPPRAFCRVVALSTAISTGSASRASGVSKLVARCPDASAPLSPSGEFAGLVSVLDSISLSLES